MSKIVDTVPKNVARKPPPKGGSRKGIPNKVTRELREMVTEALDKAGGVAYLVERARDPRTASAFLTLVGKAVPLQVNAEATVLHVTRIELIALK